MFKNTSGRMFVTDPCYEPGTWCTTELVVKKGDWNSEIIMTDEGDWGKRVAELRAYHVDHFNRVRVNDFRRIDVTIGVDSGQVGLFDAAEYEKVYKDGEEEWYKGICDDTLSKSQTAVRSFGIASSSGYGDGSYNCYVFKNPEGLVVGIRVVFIDEESEYEEFE